MENGVQSGFPHCCILFFASIWSKSILLPTNDLDELVTGDYRRLLAKARKQGQLGHGYIPCPACLLTLMKPERLGQPGRVGRIDQGLPNLAESYSDIVATEQKGRTNGQ